MNWDDLKIVLAVQKTGSMARAAEWLKIDPSTTGRRLNAIERDLGTVLFTRSKSGMTPTDAGEVVIEHAMQIERRAERLVDSLPQHRDAPKGTVRLLSNPWICTQLAARGVRQLRERFPDIELLLIANTKRRSIALGETDIALFFEQTPDDGEFAIQLGDVTYAVFGPANANPEGLEWMSIWNVKETIDPMRWMSRHVTNFQPLGFRCNDPPALIEAILAAGGKGLVPSCMGARDPRLERMHRELPPLSRQLHLLAHPDLVQSPRIQAVMSWVREVFDDVFGDPEVLESANSNKALAGG